MVGATMADAQALINSALRTISIEHQAIGALTSRIDQSFALACNILLACEGRIVVTGMGIRAHSSQNRCHAVQYRQPGHVPAPGRSKSW
jgi:hypothetical protein